MAQRTNAELCAIIQRSPQNRRRALDTLLQRHDKLIKKLALKYWLPGIDYQDLFQEATLGFRYSTLSYDPTRAAFGTHVGYGIMKYCRRLYSTCVFKKSPGDPRNRLKRVPESISQIPNNEKDQYALLQSRIAEKKTRLGPVSYNRLLKKLRRMRLTEEDKLALALAYGTGTKHLRKQWRSHLFRYWLERSIDEITKRALKNRAERLRVLAKKRQKKSRPTRQAGG